MLKVLSAGEMREVDRLTTEEYGIPSILLMENAAHAAARAIAGRLGGGVEGKSFLILCGKGNNGGDGAALARILWTQGAHPTVYLFGKVEETKGDAKINFEICRQLDTRQNSGNSASFSFIEAETSEQIDNFITNSFFDNRHACVIDALFGTGLTRKLDGDYEKLARHLAHLNTMPEVERAYFPVKPLVVSIDLPSGLDADSGQSPGASASADLTVTFTAPKLANVLPPASNCNGELIVANIGSRFELILSSPSETYLAERSDARKWLAATKFSSASYKNKRGHALLVAGSTDYAGAAVLTGNAAIVSGVGLVTIATAESARGSIASRVLPEVMTRGVRETKKGAVALGAFAEIDEFVEKSIDAVAVGSGLSSSDESTRKLVAKLVEKRRTPLVLDADGLNSMAPFELEGSDELPLILTPHEGEFLKLLGADDREAIRDRVAAARDFAVKHKVILVLKGERALTAAPDGRVVINPTGNSGLGKAGNGDTLAGILTGFIAQAAQMKVDYFETAVAAVYLAGLAGDIAAERQGKRSMLATDVRDCLTEAFRQVGG